MPCSLYLGDGCVDHKKSTWGLLLQLLVEIITFWVRFGLVHHLSSPSKQQLPHLCRSMCNNINNINDDDDDDDNNSQAYQHHLTHVFPPAYILRTLNVLDYGLSDHSSDNARSRRSFA